MRIFITLLAAVAIAGCKQNPELPAVLSPYRIDIQQGNVITQEMVGKLKAGMTRSQVRFVLGSPLVADMFHGDRWDYVYLMQRQGRPDERRRLTVIFDGDNLRTLEGDVILTDKVDEPSKPGLKPPMATAPVAPAAKPAAKPAAAPPAPKPEAAKPVEKAPAAPPPVAKPLFVPTVPMTPAPAAKPAEKPAPVAAPVAPKPAPAAADAAPAPAAAAAKPEAAKSDAKTDAAAAPKPKPDAASADEKKDAPQRGLFGRMLDKIGF